MKAKLTIISYLKNGHERTVVTEHDSCELALIIHTNKRDIKLTSLENFCQSFVLKPEEDELTAVATIINTHAYKVYSTKEEGVAA